MDQGTGTGDSDYTVITMIAYDQFDNPFTDDFTLVAEDDSCFFSKAAGGMSISDVLTAPITGTAQVYFSCMNAGLKTIYINQGASTVGSLVVTVTQVVSCEAVLSILGPDASGGLIIGFDNPTLMVTVQDLVGDPVDLATVSFQDSSMINGVDKMSNAEGIVTYVPAPLTTPGTDYFYVQVLGSSCEPQYFSPLVWWWGVNCPATIVTTSATILATDEPFILSGTWYPYTGASLTGATVNINIGDNTIPIVLNDDGTWTYTIYWNEGYGDSMLVSVNIPGTLSPCTFSYTVTWTQPQPDCIPGFSSLTITPSNPQVDSPPTVSIQVLDSLMNPIPNVSYTFSSVSRAGTGAAFSWSGITNGNGLDSFSYWNDDYGASPDNVQVMLVGTMSSCSITATVNWIVDVS